MPQTAPKTDTSTFREIRSAHEASAPSAKRRGGVGVSSVRKTGASFARGGSRQDYATPREFLAAVEARWGDLDFDLAATGANAVCERYYGPPGERPPTSGPTLVGVDSLAQDWTKLKGNLWLNPPFDRIAPWAGKCADWRKINKKRAKIFFPVPAADRFFSQRPPIV